MVDVIGPFLPSNKASVGGYVIPNVRLFLVPGEEAVWNVVLDERFCVQASDEEMRRWLPLVAHSQAIGRGYSCHGENSEVLNPFKCKIVEIGGEEAFELPGG